MATEENKAVFRRIIEEVINDKNLEVVDELFSEEYVTHPSLPGRTPGPENARRYFSNMHAAFPDILATIEAVVAEGDWVATRATMSGTHKATGKRVTWPVSVFSRFAEGKTQKIGSLPIPDNWRHS
jgi:predicted ester cyclase